MAAPAEQLSDGTFVADGMYKKKGNFIHVGEAYERPARTPGAQDDIAVVVALKKNNATTRPFFCIVVERVGGTWRPKTIGNGWKMTRVSAAALTAVDYAAVADLATREDKVTTLLSAWALNRFLTRWERRRIQPPQPPQQNAALPEPPQHEEEQLSDALFPPQLEEHLDAPLSPPPNEQQHYDAPPLSQASDKQKGGEADNETAEASQSEPGRLVLFFDDESEEEREQPLGGQAPPEHQAASATASDQRMASAGLAQQREAAPEAPRSPRRLRTATKSEAMVADLLGDPRGSVFVEPPPRVSREEEAARELRLRVWRIGLSGLDPRDVFRWEQDDLGCWVAQHHRQCEQLPDLLWSHPELGIDGHSLAGQLDMGFLVARLHF
eukprot:m51a1_g6583 hypothetical protein (382) ;mRNA; f:223231-224712